MKLLIGSTGLIGTTLKESIKFDHEFNSKNIQNILQLDITDEKPDLYLSCLPATKWLVNKNPKDDLDNILNILNVITKKDYKNIILYSTIDVYTNSPMLSNENYNIRPSHFDYGNNRLLFEKLIQSTVRYDKLLIIRLPALFGNHFKKNVLFDLLNDNEIHKINYNSKFQWYNLDNIVKDTDHYINTFKESVSILNLFTEPIDTHELLKLFKKSNKDTDTNSKPVNYNYTTKYSSTGYIQDKDTLLLEIKIFIDQYKLVYL